MIILDTQNSNPSFVIETNVILELANQTSGMIVNLHICIIHWQYMYVYLWQAQAILCI